ncbi:hypothetical protein FISHEDRAFT_57076 [Fistulina hepatica ATCC 64428]|nr:hypothetical protein FISHEDRAFT_57076 [Fistulina hepatica ATCC 64428]
MFPTVQALKTSCRRSILHAARQSCKTSKLLPRHMSSVVPTNKPWFVDDDELLPSPVASNPYEESHGIDSYHSFEYPMPENVPSALKTLHEQLLHSPHLEKSLLRVLPGSAAIPSDPAPFLPRRKPQGVRRRRRGNDSGDSWFEDDATLWSWVLLAQVKDGTENRGAIESVVRIVRKCLLTHEPPLPLPPNAKRRVHNGWAMVDAGDFAVHIFGRPVREKYFNTVYEDSDIAYKSWMPASINS